jgi:hypothetical protein
MRTIQPEPFNVYTIDELTDEKAKKKAIEFCREDATNNDWLLENVVDESKDHLIKIGFSEPKIYHDCSYCQGAGACFVADKMVHFDKFLPALKRLFNKQQWKALRKIHSSGMELELELIHRGHYYHENSVTVSLDITDHGIDRFVGDVHVTKLLDGIEEVITEWYKGFCQTLYRKLCAEIEYFWKDENCIQHAKDCDFEFTETGKYYQD